MQKLVNYYIIVLALNLARKHMRDGNLELAEHCINEVGLALDEMMKEIVSEHETQNAKE